MHMLRLAGRRYILRGLDEWLTRLRRLLESRNPISRNTLRNKEKLVKLVLQSGISIITGGPGTERQQ